MICKRITLVTSVPRGTKVANLRVDWRAIVAQKRDRWCASDIYMASFEGAESKVVNEAKPELIGRTLVPFFLSSGEDDKVNEQLQIPRGAKKDFRCRQERESRSKHFLLRADRTLRPWQRWDCGRGEGIRRWLLPARDQEGGHGPRRIHQRRTISRNPEPPGPRRPEEAREAGYAHPHDP